tara:strand:- start:853 stop:1533 length:681 start_codon:yes stop_codon:yes gene_type:complete
MKKLYRIILLLLIFSFLTTYSPKEINVLPNKSFFFKIENIEIINNYLISTNTIDEKMNKIYGKNILFIKRKDIQSLLSSIDFLKKIEVRKKYPDTIIIKVYETKPVAVLYKKDQKYLLDSSSNLIPFNTNDLLKKLPSVFGEGAEKNFINFFKKLEKNNFATKRIKNFYYFQIGRWDIQLLNDQKIKLPSNKTTEAIQQIIELLDREDFKKYKVIDLRINDKIIVE